MRVTIGELRKLIRETFLKEIDIEQVSDLKSTAGSTHLMQTGTIDGVHHFVKFSDDSMFESGDPSLQPLVEFLAYGIYRLYPQVKTPARIDLVFDPENNRVGIATAAVKGKQALMKMMPKDLGRKMSAGVYVDVFLANWDVIGTGTGNVIIDDDAGDVVRIDPGGSLTFRAQGGKKGSKFGEEPGELKTMLNPEFGAGQHFQFADLDEAAEVFLSIPWANIETRMDEINDYITSELTRHKMIDLLNEWKNEFAEIKPKLAKRWTTIASNASQI